MITWESHRFVYLAGPMSSLPDFNYPAFHRAAALLRRQLFTVINPAENPRESGTWVEYMRDSLVMLSRADAVATLEGWWNSKGAILEVHVARQLGMPVVAVQDLCGQETHA